jgi:hypothetical protein
VCNDDATGEDAAYSITGNVAENTTVNAAYSINGTVAEDVTVEASVQHVQKSIPVQATQAGKPVGFIRAKVFGRAVLVKTLIDSGNLFADLISEQLAKMLKLKITGSERKVGTAAANGSVTVIGKAKAFHLYLEGISKPVKVEPYVVRELAHPLNLGQAFLRANAAEMTFKPAGVSLKIGSSCSSLHPSSAGLDRPSIDVRIRSLLDKLKDQGGNPACLEDEILDLRVQEIQEEDQYRFPGVYYAARKKVVVWSDTRRNVYSKQAVLLKAGHTTVVESTTQKEGRPALVHKHRVNNVYLEPRKNSHFLNDKQLLVNSGCYIRTGSRVKLMISNLSEEDVLLPRYCKLGSAAEAAGVLPEAVNLLDHRPAEQLTEAELVERRAYIIESLKLDDSPLVTDNPGVREKLIQIFLDNWDAISVSDSDYGQTDLMKFVIEVPPGTKPVRAKVRPLNPMQEADLRKQLDAWEEAGIIEKSMAPWGSALVPVKKKGSSSLRWAIDFREVNLLTLKDAYPLPSIEGNLHKLSGSTVFSSLDSAGAFHNLTIEPGSRDLTTFVSCYGSYRFARLPFGLANGPAAYSRLVQMALDRLPPGFALAYIDDIIVHSSDVHSHLEHLRAVVELHARYGMKLNLKKCNVMRPEVEYLGHLVSRDGIRMIPSYVERILEWPLPQTGKDLRSFLGFSGYYRSFIPEYSSLTSEMNKMKNSTVLEWKPELVEKFEKVKKCFATKPLRGYPQYNTPEVFILDTDFSSLNMAAVLSQRQEGKEVFLGCVAKKCNKAEANYPSHKGELGAVILGLKKFEHILRAKPFLLRTDSKCVQYLNTMKEYRGIWARWQAYLASFQFKVMHRSGKLQATADALSRLPGIEEDGEPDSLEPYSYLSDLDDIYTVREILSGDVQAATAADSVLKQLIKSVLDQKKPDKEERKMLSARGISLVNVFECLEVEDGVLYFRPPKVNGVTKERRLCLPLSMLDQAFQLCHSHPLSGHFGINKTHQKMTERFFFPHLYSYISAKIRNCVPCISKKPTKEAADHKMHRESLSYFSQRVYADTVGPLTPAMFQGKICRHFVTIQDGFTRYLVAVPVENIETSTVAEAVLERWIQVYGCPEVIHTDNGPNFTSKLFQEIMKRLHILNTRTPPYSPEGNRVERAHRVLGDILRSDRRFEAKEWPSKLLAAVLAYNTTLNRVTGFSPFESVFGFPARLPVDLVFPLNRKEGRSSSNQIEEMKLRFHRIYEQICERQKAGIMLDHYRFQARSKPEFKTGDLVYFFLGRVKQGLSRKLTCRWIGPFEVKRMVSESLAIIYPYGAWCKKPLEISTIVSRLRRVEPDLTSRELRPTERNKLDLEAILDDLDELSEYLSYQHELLEDDDDAEPELQVSLPPVERAGGGGGGGGGGLGPTPLAGSAGGGSAAPPAVPPASLPQGIPQVPPVLRTTLAAPDYESETPSTTTEESSSEPGERFKMEDRPPGLEQPQGSSEDSSSREESSFARWRATARPRRELSAEESEYASPPPREDPRLQWRAPAAPSGSSSEDPEELSPARAAAGPSLSRAGASRAALRDAASRLQEHFRPKRKRKVK